ncbi:hypothetical protein J7T55_003811 [Diaporthe amygdali]|uniref:uncharacterized protein n=1 Tax=Phomopsis amygdali TaxID=1214568 RepID=UPI0022FF2419|nr:uncharacterized protein J7T55_003811 [Diaporthe amygdali]KAJ0117397.1 hypothetical protein J7T55_003811 [Diaporthe amygdali]
MFYEPGKTDHGLDHDPFKACVVPRPIGWISTTSPSGVHNLAPYSQFNNLTFDPPYVMFSANQTPSNRRKDTVANVEATGRFVWNLATWDLREAVNTTAEQVPADVDEFARAGLEKEFTTALKDPQLPMVKASPVKFECVYHTTLRLPGNPPMGSVDVVIGRVIAVHIADDVLTDGILDVRKTQPIARQIEPPCRDDVRTVSGIDNGIAKRLEIGGQIDLMRRQPQWVPNLSTARSL